MAVDNSPVYKFAGNTITLKQSELDVNKPTKYYIGNHPGGGDPNPNELSVLESTPGQNYTIKKFRILAYNDITGDSMYDEGTEQDEIQIDKKTNQICIGNNKPNVSYIYIVLMNGTPFNDIQIKIENDKKYKPVFLIEDDEEYEPILLKIKK